MKAISYLPLLAIILIGFSCSPGGSNNNPPPNPPVYTKGKMEFKLTDDPGTFAYFKIDIASLEYNESDNPAITTGWVNVPLQTTGVIDIIQYSNGRELPLGSLELLPLTVKQLRLKFGPNSSFAIWSGPVGGNYAFFPLPVHPSIANGLVIPFKVNVQAGATNRLYFDFDASRSRVQVASLAWQLLPSVRMFEAGQVSAIDGIVLPAAAKPYVRVIYMNHDGPPGDYTDTAYGYPDQTGYFKIIGLAPKRAIPDSVMGIQKVEFLPRQFTTPPYLPQEKLLTLITNTTVNTGTTTITQ